MTSHALVSFDNTTKDVISYIFLIPEIPYVYKLFLVGSCNGLICFAVRTENKYRDEELLLWNPFTEQTRYIPIPNFDGYTHKQTMEFYFVQETNDYNILSIGCTENRSGDLYVAVYRMSTNTWKIVDWIRLRLSDRLNSGEDHIEYDDREKGTSVFLNGSFHWMFTAWESSEIISFNVRDEKLSWIDCIDHAWGIPEGIYDIGIIDESLALLDCSFCSEDIEIWVMNDDGVEDSWVSKYKLGPNKVLFKGCWKNSVMTSDDENSLYFYNTDDLKMKKLLSPPKKFRLSGFSSFSLPWLPVAR